MSEGKQTCKPTGFSRGYLTSERKDIAYLSDIKNKADLVRGKVPSSQLPSYVDEAVEYPSRSDFPATGNKSLIYVALDTGSSYRWTGSTYIDFTSVEVVAPTAQALPGQAADAAATYQALQQSSGGAKFIVVNTLPSAADADPLAIYLVPKASAKTQNIYDEYIRVEPTTGTYAWEKIGDTEIDLSNYATKADATLTERRFSAWVWEGTPPTYEGKEVVLRLEDYPFGPDDPGKCWVAYTVDGEQCGPNGDPAARDDDNTKTAVTVEIGGGVGHRAATRTALPGYILGPDDPSNPNRDKPLASEAEAEALRTGKASVLDATLTPIYGDDPTKAVWVCSPATVESGGTTYAVAVSWQEAGEDGAAWYWTVDGYGNNGISQDETASSLTFTCLGTTVTATRVPVSYQLGSQSTRKLATAAQGAKADTAVQPVSGATAGHFAGLDANGGLTDSGKGASDFMAADAKIQKIYNAAGTDALDDKGQLYKATNKDASFTRTGWGTYTYNGTATGTYYGESQTVYKFGVGSPFVYIPSNGYLVYNFSGDPYATCTPHLDPTVPGVDLNPVSITGTWAYSPRQTTFNTPPYAHLSLESIPEREYSNTSTYAVGDLVKYRSSSSNPYKAYRCNTAITTAEAWNAAHWTEIPVLTQKMDPYKIKTATVSSGAVTLSDSAINVVSMSSSTASLDLTFPAALGNDGARDFFIRLELAEDLSAPDITWPASITLESADGNFPAIATSASGEGTATTLLRFSETSANHFLVTGGAAKTITPASQS